MNHREYLEKYKIMQCTTPNEHFKNLCFGFHDQNDRRRPVFFASKFFNYYPLNCHDGIKCQEIEKCHLAHNMYEMAYHPLTYKTEECPSTTLIQGQPPRGEESCPNAPQCAKAHGYRDMRDVKDIYCSPNSQISTISGNMNTNINTNMNTMNTNMNTMNMNTNMNTFPSTYQMAPPQQQLPAMRPTAPIPNQLEFQVSTYKTIECTQPSFCSNDGCLYYHNQFERRRSQMKFQYSHRPCPHVLKEGRFLDPVHCPLGEACQLAHTKFEIYYHSANFRKKVCKRGQACTYGKFCPDIHQSTHIGANPHAHTHTHTEEIVNLKVRIVQLENEKHQMEVYLYNI